MSSNGDKEDEQPYSFRSEDSDYHSSLCALTMNNMLATTETDAIPVDEYSPPTGARAVPYECTERPLTERASSGANPNVSAETKELLQDKTNVSQTEMLYIRKQDEEPEFFDVSLFYDSKDEDLATKLADILTKFITFQNNDKPKICKDNSDVDGSLGESVGKLLEKRLENSSFYFVIFSPKSQIGPREKWQEFEKQSALYYGIEREFGKIVPVKTDKLVCCGLFSSIRGIILTDLFNDHQMLDRVNVNNLKEEQLNKRMITKLAKEFEEARKNRMKLADVRNSRIEQPPTHFEPVTKSLSYSKIIKSSYDFLVDNMDTEYGLVTILFSKEVLSSREKETVEAEKTRHEKSQKLLNFLMNKTDDCFEKFLSALNQTNQGHLANKLHSQVQHQSKNP